MNLYNHASKKVGVGLSYVGYLGCKLKENIFSIGSGYFAWQLANYYT